MPAARRFELVGPPGCAADWGIGYRPYGRRSAPERRVEVGAIVSDLPVRFRDYLLAEGKIREVNHG